MYNTRGYVYAVIDEGITAINVKNPNRFLKKTNSLDTSNSAVGVYVARNYMYAANSRSRVLIVEIYYKTLSRWTSPTLFYSSCSIIYSLKYFGKYILPDSK